MINVIQFSIVEVVCSKNSEISIFFVFTNNIMQSFGVCKMSFKQMQTTLSLDNKS